LGVETKAPQEKLFLLYFQPLKAKKHQKSHEENNSHLISNPKRFR
jgi:hypothetical protein